MRRYINFFAVALAAIGMVAVHSSCTKENDFKPLSLGGESQTDYSINQKDTLKIPITIQNIGKGKLSFSASSANKKYGVEVDELVKNTTTLKVIPPDYIIDATSFTVDFAIEDAASDRTLTQQYLIKPVVASNVVVIDAHANTQIVPPGSIAVFPPSIGNSDKIADIDTVALIWQDAKGLVKKIILEDGSILADLGEDISGNALVAGYKGENIVWNWHIWVSDYNPGAVTMTYTSSVESDKATYVFMDRNIGALSGEPVTKAFGLFYQWGRKEPISINELYDIEGNVVELQKTPCSTLAAEQGVTDIYEYGNKLPATFLTGTGNSAGNYGWFLTDKTKIADYTGVWGAGTTKAVADPCPAGWRIPPYTAYAFFSDATSEGGLVREFAYDGEGEANANKIGRLVSTDGGKTKIFFPSQGEIQNNGTFGSVYTGTATWPCGKIWVADADAANNRARGISISPTSVSITGGFVTAYGIGVRCVKE